MKFKIALVDLLLAEYVLGRVCVGRRTEDELLATPLGQVYRSCFCFQQKSSDRFKSRLNASFVLQSAPWDWDIFAYKCDDIRQFKFLIVLFTKKLVLKQLVSVGNNLALQSPNKWWLAWRNQLVPGSLLSHRSHADCWTIIRCVNFPQVAYRLLYLKLVSTSKCNVSTNSS